MNNGTKPYLIRGIHAWCCDNNLTPYLVVKVAEPMEVPTEFVKAGEIVLNLSNSAVRNLQMDNDFITGSARFNGKSFDLVVPVNCVISIFARENGEGMGFEYVPNTDADKTLVQDAKEEAPRPPRGKPTLRVVK